MSTHPSKHTKGEKEKSKGNSSKHKSAKGESSEQDKDSQATDLYCAVYTPTFGNYYHWAFAMNHRPTRQWQLFQVIQEEEGGPFIRNQREVNPSNSSRCLQPLLLGRMPASRWDWLIRKVPTIPVPGEGESWNCQDYVVEIWELLRGVIGEAAWNEGYQEMLSYYGQDFGDQGENEGGEENYEEDDDGTEGGGKILSQEFVYDSDDVE